MAPPTTSSARCTLLTGPPGSGKSEAALARIREAATAAGPRGRSATPEREALLLLPTYAAAQHALRSALARWDARGLFDACFVTFTSAGERFLPGFRVRQLPSAEERDRLLLAALERVDPPVYRALRAARGLHARLLALLKEVKQGAAPPREALSALAGRAARLEGPARERFEGFLAVARAYGEALEAAGLEDHEDALHRLLAGLRSGAAGSSPGLLAVDGFDDMTPVEEAILEALVARVTAAGGEVLVTLPYDAARAGLWASNAGLRARLTALGFEERALPRFERAPGGALEHLARRVLGPPAPPELPGGEVVLLEALDAQDEADVVAREIRHLLEGAGGPDALVASARDVLLIVPDLERRGPRFEAALARLGVPVHLAGPRPLALEPWVRSATGVLRLLAGATGPGTLDVAALLGTLRHRALGGDARVPLAAVDAQEMAWRRAGFPADWDALRRAARPELAPALAAIDAWLPRAGEAGPGVGARLAAALDELAPVPSGGGLDERGAPRDGEQDRSVARALTARRRLLGLAADRARAAALVAAPTSLAALSAELLEALATATFEPSDRRLDVVHVLDPDGARAWEAPVVFLAGLDEDGLPRRVREDPLVGDDDRERLAVEGGGGLPGTSVHQERERRRLLAVLTRARRRLVLVRPTRTPAGDDLPASPLLDEVRRVLTLVAQRPGGSGVPGVAPLADCRTRDDLLRWAAHGAATPLGAALLGRLDPGLVGRAARWRRSAADPLPPAARDRCRAAAERLSPSRINTALACPQQHFLTRVAGLEGDEAPLAGPRFGVRDLGSALHEAFRRALRAPGEDAEAVADAALGEVETLGVPRRLVRQELVRAVRLLREREAATAGPLAPVPRWLERRLGAGQGVALGSGEGRFVLQGQPDRVDVAGTRALVVDYKLGQTSPRDHARSTLAGEDLQLPLYALALEREAGYVVEGFEWIAGLRRARTQLASEALAGLLGPRREGSGPILLAPEAFRARLDGLEALVSDLVARLRSGHAALEPQAEATCARCPVREACRPDRAALRRQRRERGVVEVEADAEDSE